jgi:hypothetical protein
VGRGKSHGLVKQKVALKDQKKIIFLEQINEKFNDMNSADERNKITVVLLFKNYKNTFIHQ